jgi:hypothetical protein
MFGLVIIRSFFVVMGDRWFSHNFCEGNSMSWLWIERAIEGHIFIAIECKTRLPPVHYRSGLQSEKWDVSAEMAYVMLFQIRLHWQCATEVRKLRDDAMRFSAITFIVGAHPPARSDPIITLFSVLSFTSIRQFADPHSQVNAPTAIVFARANTSSSARQLLLRDRKRPGQRKEPYGTHR